MILHKRKRVRDDKETIEKLLNDALSKCPASQFVRSLYREFKRRGSLSQMQIDALCLCVARKPGRLQKFLSNRPWGKDKKWRKTPGPKKSPIYKKDEALGQQIDSVLAINPEHKGCISIKRKFDNNEIITAIERKMLLMFAMKNKSKRVAE